MYKFISDNGHGWLRVPLSEVEGLAISTFSYMDSTHAYLEEDCDMTTFVKAKGLSDYMADWSEYVPVHGESVVRSFPRFRPNLKE